MSSVFLDSPLEDNGPSTFRDKHSQSEFHLDPDAISDTFIEPKIEITILDDDIDVDPNENGAAWGESTATTSTAKTGPESDDAAYEEFLLCYSPFVPLKRLTPQEIEDAAAGKLHLLNNNVPPMRRQLQVKRNHNDREGECDGEINLLNSTGTGIRFLDDFYEVNLSEAGHIVFKPNILHQNVDPSLSKTFIVCSMCKFVTDSKVSLKNHMKIHSKALMCSHVDCFASFDTRLSLQQHYNVWHSPLKPFRCSSPDCHKSYESWDDLKLHYSDHDHTDEYRLYRFRCTRENCTAKYKSKAALAYHTSSVNPAERPFKCPRKGFSESFVDLYCLRSHLRNESVKRYKWVDRK